MKNKINVYLTMEDKRWEKVLPDASALVQQTADVATKRVWNDVWFLDENKTFSVNLCLSNDEAVHKLNREFRGVDKPTNVLSFANYEDDSFEDMLEADAVELGDVIVALETLEREAEEQAVSLKAHFMHLWLHGLLHILGYDHMEESDAEVMEGLEIEILATLGIENPYQE